MSLSPKQWIFVIVGVIFVLYVSFQARYLILGPEIWIDSPKDGEVVMNSVVEIKGGARNAARLYLNDRQIFTDEEGYWREKLIVQRGLSIMTVTVRDRFGREEEKQIRIILN